MTFVREEQQQHNKTPPNAFPGSLSHPRLYGRLFRCARACFPKPMPPINTTQKNAKEAARLTPCPVLVDQAPTQKALRLGYLALQGWLDPEMRTET